MRCGRCGNDNADANRFCGMCGAPLAAKPQPVAPPANVTSVRNVAPPLPKPATQNSPIALESVELPPSRLRPAPVSPPQPEFRNEPAITGPSFLGLSSASLGSDGGNHRDRDTSTGRQRLESSSGSLDYLLEDEEEPKRGGIGLFLVVVALAIAIGVGYLRWKRGSFDFLGIKTPEVTTPTNSVPNSSDSSSGATSAPNSTPSAAAPSAPVTPIPTDSAAPTPANSDATNKGSAAAASPATPPPPASDAGQSGLPDAAAAPPSGSGAAADSASRSSSADSQPESTEEEPAAPAPAKPVARKPAKPSAAKPIGAMSNDSVAEAERYIYGRGVAQDCDRGLRLLKPAGQSNPKAMISLGALYSTGTCTPRDLPTAYRWFAMALHKEPDNQVLQNDLQNLWSRMTQPERQLAIKLSQ